MFLSRLVDLKYSIFYVHVKHKWYINVVKKSTNRFDKKKNSLCDMLLQQAR